jgi:hypothetical protein
MPPFQVHQEVQKWSSVRNPSTMSIWRSPFGASFGGRCCGISTRCLTDAKADLHPQRSSIDARPACASQTSPLLSLCRLCPVLICWKIDEIVTKVPLPRNHLLRDDISFERAENLTMVAALFNRPWKRPWRKWFHLLPPSRQTLAY